MDWRRVGELNEEAEEEAELGEEGSKGKRERQTTRMQTFNNACILFLLLQGIR